MTMRLTATVALATAISLCGCSKPRPLPPAPPAPTRAGESYEIGECGRRWVPSTVYKIKISGAFELRDPQIEKSTRPAKEVSPGEFDEDGASVETPYTWESDASNKTRLDVDIGLHNTNDAAMIKIVLDDPLLVFRADGAAIRAGGPNGRNMICSVRSNSHEKSVRFIVFYYKENPRDSATYGKYNIGIIARDQNTSSDYKLPIYIDPMIKNNG